VDQENCLHFGYNAAGTDYNTVNTTAHRRSTPAHAWSHPAPFNFPGAVLRVLGEQQFQGYRGRRCTVPVRHVVHGTGLQSLQRRHTATSDLWRGQHHPDAILLAGLSDHHLFPERPVDWPGRGHRHYFRCQPGDHHRGVDCRWFRPESEPLRLCAADSGVRRGVPDAVVAENQGTGLDTGGYRVFVPGHSLYERGLCRLLPAHRPDTIRHDWYCRTAGIHPDRYCGHGDHAVQPRHPDAHHHRPGGGTNHL